MKKNLKEIFNYLTYLFALIGLVLVSVYLSVKFGLTNEKGLVDMQRTTFTYPSPSKNEKKPMPVKGSWLAQEEWAVIKEAIIRDRESIYKASALLDVNPRLIVSIIMVEQLRLFTDDRELFKRVFAPLKMLGTQSQYSWGVVGIKRETAIEAEENLHVSTSPYYLGTHYENILAFTTDDHESERFARLTDEHNRYYSYLYAAVIIKELEVQWERAGYPITKKPEVIATLFNIGFTHSKPNPMPRAGGAAITIASTTYSFGALANEFYTSSELLTFFPR